MVDSVGGRGYFSLLRWRAEPSRDEARNVAVLLVDERGDLGAIKAAPISSISPRLHEQGLLDQVIAGLEAQFQEHPKPSLARLMEWQGSFRHSLSLTPPSETAIPDLDLALSALYRAYVAPRAGGSRVLTKGRLLDSVITWARKRGVEIRRGNYVENFLFDAVVGDEKPVLVDVLSFATTAQHWTPVEHDAAHFLYALERVDHADALAVIAPPTEASHRSALDAHERVGQWFAEANVATVSPDQVGDALAGTPRLI